MSTTTLSPRIMTLTSPSAKAAVTGGEPVLVVSYVSQYDLIYSDIGSGADQDVGIWRPQVPGGFYMIGDYAQGNYSQPSGSAIIVQALNDDPSNPLLKEPVGYVQVWNDSGSGGDQDGSIWYPQAPTGYITVGFVGQSGYDKPFIPTFRCLRRDLVQATPAGSQIWSDEGSGADGDVTLWQITGVTNAFVAQANYQPFAGTAYLIKA